MNEEKGNFLVVGDLHGKTGVVEAVFRAAKDLGAKPIFIGDYVDGRGVADSNESVAVLDAVLDAVEAGEAIGLLGNHELSYLNPVMRCSGYEQQTQLEISIRRSRIERLLRSHVYGNEWLITHAGVSQKLCQYMGMTVNDYLDNGDFTQIGESRGGSYPCGGLYWCDWNQEFESIMDVAQIVGHTRTRGGIVMNYAGDVCIDCLETSNEILFLYDDGTTTFIDLDEDGYLTEGKYL